MRNNRSVLFISAIALILLALIPTVSAEVIVDGELYEWVDTTVTGQQYATDGGGGDVAYGGIQFPDISRDKILSYITFELPGNHGKWKDSGEFIPNGRHDFEYEFNGKIRPGVLYLSRSTNLLGEITNTKFTIHLNDWDTGTLTGAQYIDLPFLIYQGRARVTGKLPPNAYAYSPGNYPYPDGKTITVTEVSAIPWINYLRIEEVNNGYEIILNREIENQAYKSTILVNKSNEIIFQSTATGQNEQLWFDQADIDHVTILSSSEHPYSFSLTPTPPIPDESGITVYIKNSQTGALIADANVAIDALVDGEYYPVTNRTEPSGIFSINLQPTGGGKPNPDSYRLIVTADGYNNPMPEINFTLGDYIKYFECFLDPISGGPADENKTFIDFFVRDMSSNPISGATVKFGKYTLITNSAGYTVFEVDKNNNYSWTISKSGYGPLTGNAVIGDSPRHTINTVLAPIVTPTTTTPIPTSPPIGPTPTMTAPTGEHVSNLLEWFAAHFGMLLGGGVEIGKIFMWLCFTVPVGVYVGKEAKAGAAGFMAGAGIVTLFFVLIGWVPIWLVVLMALIIGLLYAKVFNTADNGGGR